MLAIGFESNRFKAAIFNTSKKGFNNVNHMEMVEKCEAWSISIKKGLSTLFQSYLKPESNVL